MHIAFTMGSFDVAAAGPQVDLVFCIGNIDIPAGRPSIDLTRDLVDIHIAAAGPKILVRAVELFQGDIAAAGSEDSGYILGHIYLEGYAKTPVPVDTIVLWTGSHMELMVVSRNNKVELLIQPLPDLFFAKILPSVVPDIDFQSCFIVRYAGYGDITTGGLCGHLLDG